jgi:hypothetical protein
MSGYKSHGITLTKVSHAGNYSPELSEVNYAVPDKKVLKNIDFTMCMVKERQEYIQTSFQH